MTEATTEVKKPRRAKRARKPAAPKPTLDLPRNPLMFEILDLVSRQRTKAKKVEVLKKYECMPLKSILIWNFDPSIKSALPEGDVPYGEPEEQMQYSGSLSDVLEEQSRQMYENGNFSLGTVDGNGRTTIRAQWKNLYHFVVGGNGGLTTMRRESMFINLLQSVHPLEAEILCLVKDKDLESVYKVPFNAVQEAFPDIEWGGRV